MNKTLGAERILLPFPASTHLVSLSISDTLYLQALKCRKMKTLLQR